MRIRYLSIFMLIIGHHAFGQTPYKPTSSEVFSAIQKSQVLGSVLYVAAHPDDENTRLISHFANKEHMLTTYLSLTRGDGGQNLIGTHISELLGVIRTQELLKARSTDGGEQLFSRANDFGYSKHPDETLQVWDRDKVLADVVWAIRKTQPDIIVNRFDHRTAGRTHGHHTASAILSYEAFTLAGQQDVYSDQLDYVDVWTPTRQFFNTSWFFYGSRDKFAQADKSNMVSVDIGAYYPVSGKSNNEIAAASRSFHKSQGFGATGSRGSEMEYIEWVQGEEISPEDDPFKGINTTWSRIQGGAPIGTMLKKIEDHYDVANPEKSIPDLLAVYAAIEAMPNDGFWVPRKLADIREIIRWCSGLFMEAVATDYSAAPGQNISFKVEAINRSPIELSLSNLSTNVGDVDTTLKHPLSNNEANSFAFDLKIPNQLDYSSPYWLQKPGTVGMYTVDDQAKIGKPEAQRPIVIQYTVSIDGHSLAYKTPLVYKYNDPVKGEVYRPFEVSPPIYLNFVESVQIFNGSDAKQIDLVVKAGANDLSGAVRLSAPDGWSISPSDIHVDLKEKGEEQLLSFQVTAPGQASEGLVSAAFTRDGESQQFHFSATIIDYDHIPTQTILKPASIKVVGLDLAKEGDKVGYIMGAGDKVPEFLRQIGYEVTLLNEEDLSTDRLQNFDAVVVGIRAYNTKERLRFYQNILLEYVAEGGTMIVQYNTNRRLKIDSVAPYTLTISRDRVTVEEAEVRIIAPDHPIVNYPNKITAADFDGWVQERGLYFANEWDEKFTPIFSSNDPGESPKEGGMLVAQHGKGWYVYSGYSWFRELPAGVPGAYRIFANMLSLGKTNQP
ncbi:MAG: PIG-L family deacetylase [Saprospiraceae bacterium]|nr:PIG-L family deacetylase [Saprospiraceae bacterium]